MPRKMTHKPYKPKGPQYDTARDQCHVCGSVCKLNLKYGTRVCECETCQVQGVTFSIPYERGTVVALGDAGGR